MKKTLTRPSSLIMPMLCGMALLTTFAIQAQVSGTVFKDFNANGTQQSTATYSEPGFAGVVVNAYNPAGSTLTVAYTGGGGSTNNTGGYTVSGGTLGQIRLEFILPDGYTFASNGGTGGTTVMFPTGATQHLAVNYPDDYWDNGTQPIPQLLVPCYINGSTTHPSAANTGIVQLGNDQNGITGLTLNQVATFAEVGTVWGEAFQKNKNRFFFSAFLKRHAGIGSEGPGGVYIAEQTAGVYDIVGSFTLEGVVPSNSATALNFGSVTRVTSPTTDDNYLAISAANEPSRDLDAFGKVGTISYGDIDIDEASQKMYMTNLFQNRLIVLDIAGSSTSLDVASAATLGSLVSAYNVSSLPGVPSCTSGNLRIWGLKIYKGRGYLGVMCDAMTSQNQADLVGYVLSFDPANIAAGFTTELTIGTSYRNPSFWQNWHPWVANFGQTSGGGAASNYFYYQQPILSDIEFNENGDMTIAITDRLGHQMSPANYQPVSGSTTLYSGVTFGDILMARKNSSGTWVMEGTAGVIPPNHTGSDNQLMGYGNITGALGEYINDRSGDGSPEGAMGSVAKIMGTNVVIATNVDPYPVSDNSMAPYYDTGGLHWYNTTDGTWNQHARLYGQNYGVDFGKAVGLGDIEVNLGLAPLEIGNRVWLDTDNDGVQDAGESGVGNVTINLYASDGTTLLGTTTTDAGGNWYFNTTNVTDGDPNTGGNQAGPQPTITYIIRVGAADWTGGVGVGDLAGRSLTLADVGGAGQPNLRDNDATLVSSIPQISVTTGSAGQNDHSLDMGFVAICMLTSAGETLETCNNNGTPSDGSDDYITFSLNPTGSTLGATYSVTASGGGTVTLAGGGGATGVSYGSAIAFRLQNGSANGTLYTITVTDAGGAPCTAAATVQQNACVTCPTPPSVAITETNVNVCATNVATFNYTVSGGPTTTFSHNGTGTLSLAQLPNGTSTFTYTPSTSDAGTTVTITATIAAAGVCPAATDMATVTVNTSPAPTVTNGLICPGASIDLNTLVTNSSGGTPTFHSTYPHAVAGTPIISATVSPGSATNYYVRSTNASGCHGVKEITVNIKATNCDTIQVTGPN